MEYLFRVGLSPDPLLRPSVTAQRDLRSGIRVA